MILLDGAMGTELERRGARMDPPLWSAHALLEQPDCIRNIHLDYLRAGAQVITTNSFRTHAQNLAAAGPQMAARADELTQLSVALACEARALYQQQSHEPVRIAGSVSPVGDCFEPECSPVYEQALAAHRAITRSLATAGCDLFLIETMSKVDEATAAVQAASECGKPAWLSVVCDAKGNLLGGESLHDLVAACRHHLTALLVNCTDTQFLDAALPALRAATAQGPARGCYPHTGRNDPKGFVTHAGNAAWFADLLAQWAQRDPGLVIVGSCCGSTPQWTAELARRIHPTAADRRRGFDLLDELVPLHSGV